MAGNIGYMAKGNWLVRASLMLTSRVPLLTGYVYNCHEVIQESDLALRMRIP
jgi:hypothetical protein